MAKTLFLFLSLFVVAIVNAQDLYTYQSLSGIYYTTQKDSLKKNWVCPALYQDKATQKTYKDLWDDRTNFLLDAITANDYIHDGEVYGYVSQLLSDICSGNKKMVPVQPLLLLDRSSAINAYAVGKNVIVVNAGLVDFCQTREELALAIAHELSHNILDHVDNAMKEKAEWLNSKEYQQKLKGILDSKYERYSRLMKIAENYSFSRNRHNRYHESSADSLAIILLKNSNLAFNASYFLRLDSADVVYHQPLKNPLKSYFDAYNLPFQPEWTVKRTRGLSSHSYNFRDTTTIDDSLKTHPDCVVRYQNTASQTTVNGVYTPIPASVKKLSNKILLWNMFDDLRLTACLYRILLEKDNGNTDEWYDFMVHNVFFGLLYATNQLSRFNVIGIMQKEYIAKDYYALQTMLEQMSQEDLEKYCKQLANLGFWQNTTADAKGLKLLMATLNTPGPDNTDKQKDIASKNFMTSYSTSMYCELAQHFRKK